MLSAFQNSLKIPELRQRILFTLAVVVVVRLGADVTLPGIDVIELQKMIHDSQESSKGVEGVAALFNVFSGGGLQKCAVFALGIMPYISASIMMQLLTAVWPKLNKLSREDGGRVKINQYTRRATLLLSIVQGYIVIKTILNPGQNILMPGASGDYNLVPDPGIHFIIISLLCLASGTMFLMWLGDQITERGIGNGISLIIAVNIVSSLPGALVQVWETFVSGAAAENSLNPIKLVVLIGFFFLVIAAVIALTEAYRRITIQYAKRVVGRKMYGGSQFMPLKVNYANVMPIIFAQAILLFPRLISQAFPNITWLQKVTSTLVDGWPYYLVTGFMIFFFSYFWVAVMFQPQQIADDLKKNGGYIPGKRPGKPTADFLDYTMSRLTFAGAIFLTIVAILPLWLSRYMGVPATSAQFFGGTSLLILVGVLLEIMRQLETHLIQRHYDGFLRKGKIRGRMTGAARRQGGQTSSGNLLLWFYVILGIIIIFVTSYSLYTKW